MGGLFSSETNDHGGQGFLNVHPADFAARRMMRKPRGRWTGGWRRDGCAKLFRPAKFSRYVKGVIALTKRQTGRPVRRSRGGH